MNKAYEAMNVQSFGGLFMSCTQSIVSAVARGFDEFAAARAFSLEIEHLNAKSDAQLGALGLQREDIPRYVSERLITL
ncbi:hypothetical protein [Roseibium aggregatum]|uniref:DUF1127 domain-containing protein n=1 Tax=Roseibium aggregatum TaxID=187304 RepID=A0A926NW28_9HYPH|nr:hypothetical protein [Roseibium aggregatum]MBD1548442.1 hypothetical protein [Roseibium aggregatum]